MTVYLRSSFNVASPAALQSLHLRMQYDDGFVAYLNGQKVAGTERAGVAAVEFAATASHPNGQAVVFEDINLSDKLNLLQAGNNVLAIQALNQSAADGDFLNGAGAAGIFVDEREFEVFLHGYGRRIQPEWLCGVCRGHEIQRKPRIFHVWNVQPIDHDGHAGSDGDVYNEWFDADFVERICLQRAVDDQWHTDGAGGGIQDGVFAVQRGYRKLYLCGGCGWQSPTGCNAAGMAFELGREYGGLWHGPSGGE